MKIHKAVNLPAKDFSGTSDPYVKIYLLPDRKTKHQTKVHRKTLNPVFDEVFLFPVPYNDLEARKLHFSVYDFDRFSRHDLIGQVVVDHFLDLADFPRECILWKDIEYVTNVSPAFRLFGGGVEVFLGQHANKGLIPYFIWGAKYEIHVNIHRTMASEPPRVFLETGRSQYSLRNFQELLMQTIFKNSLRSFLLSNSQQFSNRR